MYKRILAAAIIIIIAFVYVQWGMDYIYAYEWDKTAPDREALTNDIQNTQKILNQPLTIDATLAQQLVDLQAQVAEETEKFPDEVDITGVVDDLLHLAQVAGIDIIPLQNGDWSASREQAYAGYHIQLLITGNIDNIVSFVNQVEDTMLNSINIESMELKGDEIGPGGTDDPVQGYITVTVYKRL
jgi:Tfp pilus assembly protein PilO